MNPLKTPFFEKNVVMGYGLSLAKNELSASRVKNLKSIPFGVSW